MVVPSGFNNWHTGPILPVVPAALSCSSCEPVQLRYFTHFCSMKTCLDTFWGFVNLKKLIKNRALVVATRKSLRICDPTVLRAFPSMIYCYIIQDVTQKLEERGPENLGNDEWCCEFPCADCGKSNGKSNISANLGEIVEKCSNYSVVVLNRYYFIQGQKKQSWMKHHVMVPKLSR